MASIEILHRDLEVVIICLDNRIWLTLQRDITWILSNGREGLRGNTHNLNLVVCVILRLLLTAPLSQKDIKAVQTLHKAWYEREPHALFGDINTIKKRMRLPKQDNRTQSTASTQNVRYATIWKRSKVEVQLFFSAT